MDYKFKIIFFYTEEKILQFSFKFRELSINVLSLDNLYNLLINESENNAQGIF